MITISPNENVQGVVGIPTCFEAIATIVIPQEDERYIDLPSSGTNWTYTANVWKKTSGGLDVDDAPARVANKIYSFQPFYISSLNLTFTTPAAPNRKYSSYVGVQDSAGNFYGWLVYKDCGNQSPTNCNSTTSGNSNQNWKAYFLAADSNMGAVPNGVNASEQFRLRSDGINFYWDWYTSAGATHNRWILGIWTMTIPTTENFTFFLNSRYVNNEWHYVRTFRGSYQGTVPTIWSAPLGGTILGTGDKRCFQSNVAGNFNVCVESEFDDPVCVDIAINPLYFRPTDRPCGACAFTGEVLTFESNGGYTGTLTATAGTVIDALTWQAPGTPQSVTLTYTIDEEEVTCQIDVIDRVKIYNVEGDTIRGLVPGDVFQIRTNYDVENWTGSEPLNLVWTNVDCPNLVQPNGLVVIPKIYSDSCYGAKDCYIEAALVNVPGSTCNNFTTGANQYKIRLRIIVDPVFPTPDLGGPVPAKWKPETPEYKVVVNNFEGGCDETYLKNRVAIRRWSVDYRNLMLDYDNPCDPTPCCNPEEQYVNGMGPQFHHARILDDFWNMVAGTSGYFTLIEYRTGKVWRHVRFEGTMERDHINWRRTQSRTFTLVWSPCCASEPKGGVCPHHTIKDVIAPTTPDNLTAVAASPYNIEVMWDAATDNIGVQGYQLMIDGVVVDLSNRLYYNHRVEMGSTHTYRVRSYDFDGNFSQWSDPVSETTPIIDNIPPTVPGHVTATVLFEDHIQVTWLASMDNVAVTGYKIYIDGVVIDIGDVLSYDHTVTPGTTHEYRVRAYDAAGNHSKWSGVATADAPIYLREGADYVFENGDYVIE